MKRKYKDTQDRVDATIAAAIQSGERTNAALAQVIKDGWAEFSVGELVDCFARTELSASKQRLRADGLIEITKGNLPIPVDQLNPDDAAFIDERRAAHIAGELKTRVEFNHRHGRAEAAAEAGRQLSLFDIPEAVEAVGAEVEAAFSEQD